MKTFKRAKIILYCIFAFLTACFGFKTVNVLAPQPEDFFKMVAVDSRWPERPFVLEVPVSAYFNGIAFRERFANDHVPVDSEGNPDIGIPVGEIQRVTPKPEHNWSFRFVSSGIQFGDYAMEICDGSFGYVEEHFEIQSRVNYCPWGFKGNIRQIWFKGKLIYNRP